MKRQERGAKTNLVLRGGLLLLRLGLLLGRHDGGLSLLENSSHCNPIETKGEMRASDGRWPKDHRSDDCGQR